MTTLAALHLRPSTFDPVGALQQATQLQQARTQQEMTGLRMQEMQEEMRENRERRGALSQFRTAGGIASPGALNTLSGHPEMYNSALASMSQRQQYQLMANARGAQRVMGFPEGSPERVAEYRRELDTALQEQRIDAATHQRLSGQQPTNLFLSNIIAQGRPLSEGPSQREVFEMMGLSEPASGAPPAAAARPAASPAPMALPAGADVRAEATGAPGSVIGRSANAITAIESGGRYDAMGPVTPRGDRAYGRYQVMGSNIPAWTERHFGQRLTPQEFLANPQAQDAVFNGEFGSYLQRYGNPEDAASMWFTGRPFAEGRNRTDRSPNHPNGLTGSEYVQRFMAGFNGGGGGQPAMDRAQAALPAMPAAAPGAGAAFGADVPTDNLPIPSFTTPQLPTPTARPVVPGAPADPTAAPGPLAGTPRTVRELVAGATPAQRAGLALHIAKKDYDSAAKLLRELETGGMTGRQTAETEEGLRREYASQAKPYFEMRDAINRIEASTAGPAGDLSLIYNFMKMLDPGSVVREGEFALIGRSGGLPTQVQAYFNRLAGNGQLTDEQRNQIRTESRGLLAAQQAQYGRIQEQYRGIARRLNLNTDNVIIDYTPPPASERPRPGNDPLGIR
jgi:hypothetical protein